MLQGSGFSHCDQEHVRLACGAGVYNAERLQRKLDMAQEGAVDLPNGWTVDDAILRPVTDAELEAVLADLVELKARDRWPNETYPERVSTLALWLAQFPAWRAPSRYGVAWTVIFLGMLDHEFELRRGHHATILRPFPELFEDHGTPKTVSELTAVLRLAYVDSKHHRRRWLRQRAEARRLAKETAALDRQLALHTRYPSIDARGYGGRTARDRRPIATVLVGQRGDRK